MSDVPMSLNEGLDLDAIEARANAATKGPWEYQDCEMPPWRSMEIYGPPGSHPLSLPLLDEAGGSDWIANAQFIAHARTDVPDLIAEVRALRNQVDKLNKEILSAAVANNE